MIEGNYYKVNLRNYNSEANNLVGGTLLAGTHFGKKDFRSFLNAGILLFDEPTTRTLPFLGVGLSWKRSLKLEYRTHLALGQVSIGYMYNF